MDTALDSPLTVPARGRRRGLHRATAALTIGVAQLALVASGSAAALAATTSPSSEPVSTSIVTSIGASGTLAEPAVTRQARAAATTSL